MVNNKKYFFIGSCFLGITSMSFSSNSCPLNEAFGEGSFINYEEVRSYQFRGLIIDPPSRFIQSPVLVPDEQSSTADDQEENKFTKFLPQHIKILQYIQSIREFDPNLLKENFDRASLNTFETQLAKFGEPFIRQLLGFYSEDASIRTISFEREIRDPLLKMLREVTENSHMLPKSLHYLAHTLDLGTSPLLNVAIKDIFSHHPEALSGLQKALEEILDKILSKNELNDLSESTDKQIYIFKKLAGYYYDKEAVKNLTDSLTSNLSLFSEENNKKQRLAILGTLQRIGELLKPVLPITLNLDMNLPNAKLLLRIRSKLAHLTFKRLTELLSNEEEDLFINLRSDLEHLKLLLENLPSKIPPQPSDEASTLALWHHLKNENHGSQEDALAWVKQEDGKWQGFKGLYKFFYPETFKDVEIQKLKALQHYFQRMMMKEILDSTESQAFNALCNELIIDSTLPVENNFKELEKRIVELSPPKVQPSYDYSKEVEYFLPCDVDEGHLKILEQKKNKERKSLNEKANWLESLHSFKRPLKKADENKLNGICQKLKLDKEGQTSEVRIQECINHLEQAPYVKQLYNLKKEEREEKDKDRKNQLMQKTKKALDDIIDEILKITPEDKKAFETKKNLKKAQENLKQKLQKIKPLKGWMFQDTVSELLDLMNEERQRAGIPSINFTYDWLAEPGKGHSTEEATQFEKILYKVHDIRFDTLSDKNNHRATTIAPLLEIIALMREEAQIKTDVRQEQLKQTIQTTLQGKLQIMSNACRSFRPKSEFTQQDLVNAQQDPKMRSILTFQAYLEDTNKRNEAKAYLDKNPEFRKDLVLHIQICSSTQIGNQARKWNNNEIIDYLAANVSIYSQKPIIKNWLEQELQIIAFKCSQMIKDKLIKYVIEAENVINEINVSSIESFDSIKERIEDIKRKFISIYKEDSQNSLLEKDDLTFVETQLFNQLLAEKRFLIDQYSLESRILSNPLDDIYNLIGRIKSNFSEENPLNVAAHRFLVGFFYEALKEIIDYPEISSLEGTVQLRNHYYHESLGGSITPRISGRNTTHLSKEGSLSQDIVTITLNIKFILENLKSRLLNIST
jgi:hypothetical protein